MNTIEKRLTSESNAAKAFDAQSSVFDSIYSSNSTIQYKRDRVREHIESIIPSQSNILELNAGTGEDAIYFAKKGHHVHATDISEGMQFELKKKAGSAGLQDYISTEICSFTQLEQLQKKDPYDLIFSNFAGLNCTGELTEVLKSLSSLTKPGGTVTLVVMPGFCLWETMFALKGRFKTAFRRLRSKNGVQAHIEGEYFTCWYYSPSFIYESLKGDFELVGIEGLCTIVPPSYLEQFPERFPRLFKWLCKMEDIYKSHRIFRNIGDYFIISLQKKV
ncbi:MAG: class I SAM-dependent methyltransferase [Cytophagia bacterium]|nr:class I SAM-dependent methyltransferase [Cytophagia bacterium]